MIHFQLGRIVGLTSFISQLSLGCAFLVLLLCGCAPRTEPPTRSGVPWDLRRLSAPPSVEWGTTTSNGAIQVQEVIYAGEPLAGHATRVFAYLGRPRSTNGHTVRSPGMVLVHGGGGKAFKEWAEHWAKRGYFALAMDLAGQGTNGPLQYGGPSQLDTVKFRNFTEREGPEMWTYHAVASVLLGHSLLRTVPGVDPDRIGITGISWGGYLTCIAAGIDSRFRVAVPVYGCGFLGDNSVWKDGALAAMTPDARERWLRWFDPSRYVGGVHYPILFVNGTTDFAYPLDSYQKTYRLVAPRWRSVSVAVNRPHGHIWTFPEVDAFVDGVLAGKPALMRIGPVVVKDGKLVARVIGATPGSSQREPSLCYTTDRGEWQKRQWRTVEARVVNGRLEAELPLDRPMVAFLAVKDGDGNHVSSEHVELVGPRL